MVSSVNSLANMEYMLYGGASGLNANTPSYLNGYRANTGFYGNYYNPYMMQGYYNNPQTGSVFSNQSGTAQAKTSNVSFNGDWNTLGDYYIKGQSPSGSIGSAAIGGAAFGLMTNLRFIAHPWNSLSTIGKVEKTFADVRKKGTKMYELWRNPETHKLMTDAYARMHKLEGGANRWRLGLFKARLDKDYGRLKSEMISALESGDPKRIATATEKIRVATNAKTGYIPQAWNKLKVAMGGEASKTIAERIADKGAISQAVGKNLTEKGVQLGLKDQFKHSLKGQGGLGGVAMFGLEYVLDWSKIKSAFAKDDSTGWTQVGQTTARGLGSLIGWTAGEAVGTWAGAKLGAIAGTAIAPGVGTAIGAIAGLVCGSIGCALAGKLTRKIVGEDVGAKAEVENMKKTPEGQAQLLQLTAQQAMSDKKLDPKVALALQNIAGQFSA